MRSFTGADENPEAAVGQVEACRTAARNARATRPPPYPAPPVSTSAAQGTAARTAAPHGGTLRNSVIGGRTSSLSQLDLVEIARLRTSTSEAQAVASCGAETSKTRWTTCLGSRDRARSTRRWRGAVDADTQGELFVELAAHGIGQRLAEAHAAAGEEPVPLFPTALLHHQDTTLVHEEACYANRRLVSGEGAADVRGPGRGVPFDSVRHASPLCSTLDPNAARAASFRGGSRQASVTCFEPHLGERHEQQLGDAVADAHRERLVRGRC